MTPVRKPALVLNPKQQTPNNKQQTPNPKPQTTMLNLQSNTKAPTFKGKDQNGNTISLADFKGKNIVLYFYPQDDTPTCTTQACNFRDNFDTLTEQGFVVIGVSPDEIIKHKKFETKLQS